MVDLKALKIKIEESLTQYLGMDISSLLEGTDLAYIYGGSIRDIIIGDEINDIDIICGPKSRKQLINNLNINGYSVSDLTDSTTHNMYHEITCITEPLTLIKVFNNTIKKVQLITPYAKCVTTKHPNEINSDDIRLSCEYLLDNIDITCCALSYNKDKGIVEHVFNAANDAFNKVFFYDDRKKMSATINSNRKFSRISKHTNKGFKLLNEVDFIEYLVPYYKMWKRNMKIDNLLIL